MIINTKDFISHTIKSIKENKDTFYIKYFHKENFIPKQIVFDEELAWYLGLRQGDRAEKNKGVIGIVNTNNSIIKKVFKIYTKKFSIPLNKIKIDLMYKDKKGLNESLKFIQNFKIPKNNIKIRYYNTCKKTIISIYVYNIVLNRIFSWCQNNIEFILKKQPRPISYAYHAGYFDADGHPNKTSYCFEWRTINLDYALLEQRLLKSIGFKVCLQKLWEKRLKKNSFEIKIGNKKEIRFNDFNLFTNLIPFMIHSEKINECKELIKGNRIRRLDLKKYLPPLIKKFNNDPFIRKDFCRICNLSKPSACRILKAFANKDIVEVQVGKRIRINDRFMGQEPNIFKLNFLEINKLI